MAQCVVIDVTDYGNWRHLPGRDVIPCRPTVMHDSVDIAFEEALRLAKECPQKQFAVFEVVALATSKNVPTHITLGGSEIGSQPMPYIMEIASRRDEGLPF